MHYTHREYLSLCLGERPGSSEDVALFFWVVFWVPVSSLCLSMWCNTLSPTFYLWLAFVECQDWHVRVILCGAQNRARRVRGTMEGRTFQRTRCAQGVQRQRAKQRGEQGEAVGQNRLRARERTASRRHRVLGHFTARTYVWLCAGWRSVTYAEGGQQAFNGKVIILWSEGGIPEAERLTMFNNG